MEENPSLLIDKDSEVRGRDKYGSGHFGSSRGKRIHNGTDYVCDGGTYILASVDGVVSRTSGQVYRHKASWRYIEITDKLGLRWRYMYCKPWNIELCKKVSRGDVIGVCQGIETLYPEITKHIHLEIKDKEKYLDPVEHLKNLCLSHPMRG